MGSRLRNQSNMPSSRNNPLRIATSLANTQKNIICQPITAAADVKISV